MRVAHNRVAGPKPASADTASAASVSEALNNAPLSAFHRRAVVVSGVGFFTAAYDLFVISTVAALVAVQWHLSTSQTSWVLGSAILEAFVGVFLVPALQERLGLRPMIAIAAVSTVAG